MEVEIDREITGGKESEPETLVGTMGSLCAPRRLRTRLVV